MPTGANLDLSRDHTLSCAEALERVDLAERERLQIPARDGFPLEAEILRGMEELEGMLK